MRHTRIRPFNTKDTYPEQNLDNDLCQAVVANGVVYIRGQIGQDLDTRENVGVGDLEAQTDKAMSNIKLLVEEAGGTMEDIVKVVVYLTDVRFRETVYRTMGKWLKGVYPERLLRHPVRLRAVRRNPRQRISRCFQRTLPALK